MMLRESPMPRIMLRCIIKLLPCVNMMEHILCLLFLSDPLVLGCLFALAECITTHSLAVNCHQDVDRTYEAAAPPARIAPVSPSAMTFGVNAKLRRASTERPSVGRRARSMVI